MRIGQLNAKAEVPREMLKGLNAKPHLLKEFLQLLDIRIVRSDKNIVDPCYKKCDCAVAGYAIK